MNEIKLFIVAPVGNQIKKSIPDLIRSSSWKIKPIQKLNNEEIENIMKEKPAACLFSVNDFHTGKEVAKALHRLRDYQFLNQINHTDKRLRIVVVIEDVTVPFDRWQPVGVNEIIYAPFSSKQLEFKLMRHYEKLINAPEISEINEPKKEDAYRIRNITEKIFHRTEMIKSEKMVDQKEIYTIKKSELKDQNGYFVIESKISDLNPNSGYWALHEETIQNLDKLWSWRRNDGSEVKSGYTLQFTGELPIYNENKNWEFHGKNVSLNMVNSINKSETKNVFSSTKDKNITISIESLKLPIEVKKINYEQNIADINEPQVKAAFNLNNKNLENIHSNDLEKSNSVENSPLKTNFSSLYLTQEQNKVVNDQSKNVEQEAEDILKKYGINKQDSIEDVLAKIRQVESEEQIKNKVKTQNVTLNDKPKSNQVNSININNVDTSVDLIESKKEINNQTVDKFKGNISNPIEQLLDNALSPEKFSNKSNVYNIEQINKSGSSSRANKTEVEVKNTNQSQEINRVVHHQSSEYQSNNTASHDNQSNLNKKSYDIKSSSTENIMNDLNQTSQKKDNFDNNQHLHNSSDNERSNFSFKENVESNDKDFKISNSKQNETGWSQQMSEEELRRRGEKELQDFIKNNPELIKNIESNENLNDPNKILEYLKNVKSSTNDEIHTGFFKTIIKKIKKIFANNR